MEHQINLIVEEGDAGKRLDAFVASSGLDLSRSYIQKLIKDHRVEVNGNFSVKSKTAVSTSDLITIHLPEPEDLTITPQNIPLDILYEDQDVLVVNKPKGMVVHP